MNNQTQTLHPRLLLTVGAADTVDQSIFDIDGDGQFSPFRDAALLFAWMSVGTPDSVMSGFIGENATRRTPSAVIAHLNAHASRFDIDGNGSQNPFQDAVLVFAWMSPGTPDSTYSRFIGNNANPDRNTPQGIRNYLGPLDSGGGGGGGGGNQLVQISDSADDRFNDRDPLISSNLGFFVRDLTPDGLQRRGQTESPGAAVSQNTRFVIDGFIGRNGQVITGATDVLDRYSIRVSQNAQVTLRLESSEYPMGLRSVDDGFLLPISNESSRATTVSLNAGQQLRFDVTSTDSAVVLLRTSLFTTYQLIVEVIVG